MSQHEPAEQARLENFRIWRRPIHSLPTRIGFFVLAATLCASLAVTAISARLIDSFLREAIEEAFPAILERTANELEHWYENRQRELQTLAENPVLGRALSELVQSPGSSGALAAVSREFDHLLADTPEVSAVFLRDSRGATLLWRGPEIELSTGMREEIRRSGFSHAGYSRGRYFQIASHSLTSRRDVYPDVDSAIGSEKETADKVGPTLHLVVNLEQLTPILRLHGRGFSEKISIVSSDRRYLSSSSDAPNKREFLLPLATSDTPGRAADSIGPKGERLISSSMALTRLAKPGWTLVIQDEYDLAFARVVAATQHVLGINLAIVALFALIAYRLAVAIVRPIEALSVAAIRISRGEKNVKLPASTSRDEVGLLTSAISEMTNRLDANAQQIEAAQRSVEDVNAELRSRNAELYRANEVLSQLSITDGLTQLHNHRYFQDTMVKEARRADRTHEPLALILIDIDHFKSWNDRLGHAGGDEILRLISKLMSELLRTTDILARYGGEEFTLIAPGTSLEGAVQLAEKMRGTIGKTRFFLDPPSERQSVTVSMGVALYCGDRKRLFSEADQALYRAKGAGRDCVMAFDELEG